MPVAALLLFVIIDFGMAMDQRLVMEHAVREGAREAAVCDNVAAICQRIVCQAQGVIDPATKATIEYYDLDGNDHWDAGDNVTVKIPYEWDLPIVNSALPALHLPTVKPVNLTASGSARLERTVNFGGLVTCNRADSYNCSVDQGCP